MLEGGGILPLMLGGDGTPPMLGGGGMVEGCGTAPILGGCPAPGLGAEFCIGGMSLLWKSPLRILSLLGLSEFLGLVFLPFRLVARA